MFRLKCNSVSLDAYNALKSRIKDIDFSKKKLISEAHFYKIMLKAEKARLYRLIDQKNITIKNLEKALAKYENDDLKNGKYKLKKQDKPRRANGQFKAKGEK